MNLELLAIRWLRWEKRCVSIVTERSPRELWCGKPDVLGMTKDRYLCEVEIKRSMSDFRADAKKISRRNREFRPEQFPKQFYYLVPNSLALKVNGEIPAWAGLMCGPGSEDVQRVHVVKPSPVWKPSTKLTVKECVMLAHNMCSQIVTFAESIERLENREQDDGNEPWMWDYHPGYNNFQI